MRHLATGIALLLLTAGCNAEPAEQPADDAAADPFSSAEVTVSGRVAEVFPGLGFTIEGDDISFDRGAPALVLAPDASDVTEDHFVRATGEVTRFVLDEADPSLVAEDDGLLDDYEDQYVMRAQTVDPIDPPGPRAEVLERALDDPETEIFETLTLTARVQEVLGPQAFWIAGSGDNGVVVVTKLREEIDEGDVVEMTGTVMPFDPAAIQSEAGIILRSDVAGQIEQRLDEDVVFVADRVTLADVNP